MINYRMADILPLLGLPLPEFRRDCNVPCPNCDRGRDKHLNINLEKDVFRCPRCGVQGGVFDLYALYIGISRENVLADLRNKAGRYEFPMQRKVQPTSMPEPAPCADISTRDETYRALLELLHLAPDHQENLLNRGLSPEMICANGYRTAPIVGGDELARLLLAEGYALTGVPGFYCENAQWSFAAGQRGILIPVRDLEGRIQGLQLRLDDTDKRKFRWISSASYPGGCRAEAFTHFAGQLQEKILLIEGPLKADVVHHLAGLPVLAVPGVNALQHLEQTLLALRERGVRHIMTVFDMDFLKNFYVQAGYAELTKTLERLGFCYGTYLWDPAFNGLDDYIFNQQKRRNHHANRN